MTAAVAVVVDLAIVDVTFQIGAPVIPLGPEDTGGRSRWWLQVVPRGGAIRGADGRKGRVKRPPLPNRGFVPLGPDPRRTATGPCTFVAPVAPGERYTLGVGVGNRIELTIPYDVRPGAVVTIEPTSPGEADVTWSIPSADVPF